MSQDHDESYNGTISIFSNEGMQFGIWNKKEKKEFKRRVRMIF